MKKTIIIPIFLLLTACAQTNISSKVSSANNSSSITATSGSVSYEIINLEPNDLQLTLNDEGSEYTIKSYTGNEVYISLPSSYNEIPITGIANSAFSSGNGIMEIYIPDSIINIDSKAFLDCFTLTKINVNESHSVFSSIDGILCSKDQKTLIAYPLGKSSVVNDIPTSIETIGPYAFASAQKIKSIYLSDTITSLSEHSFDACKKMTEITLSNNISDIPTYCFANCSDLSVINFGTGITTLDTYSFYQCTGIVDLVLPDSLIDIKNSAFEGCTHIVNLTFGNSVKNIGNKAFSYCENLKNIEFSSSIETIGDYAFIQNYKLTEVTFAEGLISLGDGAFLYNTRLRKVNLPASLQSIGFQTFSSSDSFLEEFTIAEGSEYFTVKDNVLYSKDLSVLYVYPARKGYTAYVNDSTNTDVFYYTVDENCTEIADVAFYCALSLKEITLPKGLEKIGCIPLFLCSSLEKITYLGTKEEFLAIEKEVYVEYDEDTETSNSYNWNNTYSSSITSIYCSDGILTVD